jgi:threonine/homoserine/homoserine lactone efflux protein
MVRYLGAVYLAYLGIAPLTSGRCRRGDAPPEPLRRIFAEASWSICATPRRRFSSSPSCPSSSARDVLRLQIVVLGLIFNVMGVLTDTVYAGGRRVGAGFRPTTASIRRVAVATTYIALSVLALLVHPTKF